MTSPRIFLPTYCGRSDKNKNTRFSLSLNAINQPIFLNCFHFVVVSHDLTSKKRNLSQPARILCFRFRLRWCSYEKVLFFFSSLYLYTPCGACVFVRDVDFCLDHSVVVIRSFIFCLHRDGDNSGSFALQNVAELGDRCCRRSLALPNDHLRGSWSPTKLWFGFVFRRGLWTVCCRLLEFYLLDNHLHAADDGLLLTQTTGQGTLSSFTISCPNL